MANAHIMQKRSKLLNINEFNLKYQSRECRNTRPSRTAAISKLGRHNQFGFASFFHQTYTFFETRNNTLFTYYKF